MFGFIVACFIPDTKNLELELSIFSWTWFVHLLHNTKPLCVTGGTFCSYNT